MRLTRIAPALALALSFSASGCSKDSTGPAIGLSQTEVAGLFTEITAVTDLINVGFSLTKGASGGPLFSARPSFSALVPITGSVNCPGGGNVSASGNYSGTTTVTFDATFAFNACKTTNYTVGGSFRFFGSFSQTQTTISEQLTVTGTLTVNASGGRSGSCTINFTVTVSGSLSSPTVTVTGTICGVNASGTV